MRSTSIAHQQTNPTAKSQLYFLLTYSCNMNNHLIPAVSNVRTNLAALCSDQEPLRDIFKKMMNLQTINIII